MVFLFLLLITLLLVTSKIRIEIDNLRFRGEILNKKEKNKSYLNNSYNIKISLNILSKIPILWININKDKIEKLKQNNKFKNIDFKNARKNIKVNDIKDIKNQINIKIKKFYLKVSIGTDSTMFTTFLIPIISSIISIILANKRIKQKNLYFKINPIFNMRKFIKYSIFWYI